MGATMSLIKEFKEFAVKGNVADMAIGIIIGTAFGKIITSLVNDVIMPPLGLLVGGVDFSDKAVVLRAAVDKTPAIVLKYGAFINTIVDFTIVAFAIFLVMKGMNTLRKKQAAVPVAPVAPTTSEKLLAEIRDLLKK
jgi:large conductance mechanosensitive channel